LEGYWFEGFWFGYVCSGLQNNYKQAKISTNGGLRVKKFPRFGQISGKQNYPPPRGVHFSCSSGKVLNKRRKDERIGRFL